MSKISRLLFTLRYLRPIQVYGRLIFKFKRPKVKQGKRELVRRKISGKWIIPPLAGGEWVNNKNELQFKALNKVSSYDSSLFWSDSSETYLQLYNRHYFDAFKAGEQGLGSLLDSWIKENQQGSSPGWEPYPTSLRIVNWISGALSGNKLFELHLDSLATQLRYLQKRFEFHLQGNHLFVNGKASIFGGCFFNGGEADQWLERGLKLLRKEIPEQVQNDGMNYEQSPMYHAIFLVDLLDLINLSQLFSGRIPAIDVDLWERTAKSMLLTLRFLTHPDGTLATFGDTASKVVPSTKQIIHYARRLQVYTDNEKLPVILKKSGYIRLERGETVLLIKAGHLGPNHLLAHAHADNLTFELSYKGKKVITDMGIDRYGNDLERQKQRSTISHNTVTIDEQNSSEVWGGFRVAKRAFPLEIVHTVNHDADQVSCGHTGYNRLKDPVIHNRKFQLENSQLTIIDTFDAKAKHNYHWNLYSFHKIKIKNINKILSPVETEICSEFGKTVKVYRYHYNWQGTDSSLVSQILFDA